MNHLSFGRKRVRTLENKNTILETKIRAFDESIFDKNEYSVAAPVIGRSGALGGGNPRKDDAGLLGLSRQFCLGG